MSLFRNEFEMVPRKRLLNGVVTHYHIKSQDVASPLDFLKRVRVTVIKFFKDHRPHNKIQLSLICEMMRVDPVTGTIKNTQCCRTAISRGGGSLQ